MSPEDKAYDEGYDSYSSGMDEEEIENPYCEEETPGLYNSFENGWYAAFYENED